MQPSHPFVQQYQCPLLPCFQSCAILMGGNYVYKLCAILADRNRMLQRACIYNKTTPVASSALTSIEKILYPLVNMVGQAAISSIQLRKLVCRPFEGIC